MATITIYASSVSGATWTNPNNAAGAPSSGNNTPYATRTLAAGNSDTLTSTFAATAIPGTVTAVDALVTARSTVGGSDTEGTADGAPMTYLAVVTVPITNFAALSTSATASAASFATFKAAIEAGTYTMDLTFSTTAGATIDVKGIGLLITYTQYEDAGNPGATDVGLKRAAYITHIG